MNEFLVQRIVRQPRGIAARLALAIALAGLALGIRLALAPWIGLGAPFAAFILAVLVAAVFGGVMSAVACVVLLVAGGMTLLEPQSAQIAARRLVMGVAFFVASSSFVIWVVTLLRGALAREIAAREGERLLKLELHHRVKNTLAVVQSLADQTFRGAVDAEAARRDFSARLAALADAHDVLVDAGWREVTLRAVAERTLRPFLPADPARLSLEGEPVTVAPDAAVALALCLHELATNATKHGALSARGGQVRFAWRLSAPGRLTLEWRESGGPPLRPSKRQGFGSRLLTRALAAQDNAEAELSLQPDGARWTAAFDV